MDQYSVPDPSQENTMNPEDNCKEDHIDEVLSIDNNITQNQEDIIKEEDERIEETSSIHNNITINPEDICRESKNIEKMSSIENTITTEEAQLDDGERSSCSSDTDVSDSEGLCITRSNSCKEFTTTALSPLSEEQMTMESTNIENGSQEFHKQIIPKSKSEADVQTISQQDSLTNEKEIEQTIKSSADGDVSNELLSVDPETVLVGFYSHIVAITNFNLFKIKNLFIANLMAG